MTPTRDAIQSNAVDAIVRERQRGIKSTLIQLPTQVGKTRLACKYVRRGMEEWNGRFLVCAHMGELLDQFGRELDAMDVRYRVEKADQRALDWMELDPSIRVCLGSKDTLQNRGRNRRLDRWPKDFFTDVIEDECHLAVSNTWVNVHNHFDSAFRLGMTATIDRLDGVPLSKVFESVAYRYPIQDAIRNGHRVRFSTVECETDIDIRGLRANRQGAFDPEQVKVRIAPKLEEIANIVRKHLDRLNIGKAIAFLPDRLSAYAMADIFTQIGVPSKGVCGENPARNSIVAGHRQGDFRVLCNKKLLGMGYNDPGIDAVIHLQPTMSRSWYDQMSGRCGATREGKEFGYLLYVGWRSDLSLIGPTDIFTYDDSEKVRSQARRLAKLAKGPTDPQALVETARELVAADERRERKLRYQAAKRDVKHRYREYDPIGVALRSGIEVADHAADRTPRDAGLKATLAAMGLKDAAGLSNRAMAEMVRYWSDRHECGMATLKQYVYLTKRKAVHPAKVIGMTSGEASLAIDRLHPSFR